MFGGARLPHGLLIRPGKVARTPKIGDKGLSMRRAVARDRPRLGAFNGLIARLSEDHEALR